MSEMKTEEQWCATCVSYKIRLGFRIQPASSISQQRDMVSDLVYLLRPLINRS
jgi:hypothetical protein